MQPSKKSFDSELQAYFNSIKHTIKEEHLTYLKSHPQLRQILNDFLSSCLLKQPQDVYLYAQNYFAYFDYQKDVVKYKPLVVSGCSGAGKGTFTSYLLSRYPNRFEFSISYTTRRPRQGEVQGRQYFFVTKEQFEREIAKEVFLEYAEVHGNYYGTHKGKLKDIMSKGKIALLDVDLSGGQKIHANNIQCNYLFIIAPSLEELEKRLRARGQDEEQSILKRVQNAKKELERRETLSFYHNILNDDRQKLYEQGEEFLRNNYQGFI